MPIIFVLVALTAAQTPPEEWTCDAARFADATCDCGCGAVDEDCPSSSSDVCERDNCPEGQVAWEQNNESCMDEGGGCAATRRAPALALLTLFAPVVLALRRRRSTTTRR